MTNAEIIKILNKFKSDNTDIDSVIAQLYGKK